MIDSSRPAPAGRRTPVSLTTLVLASILAAGAVGSAPAPAAPAQTDTAVGCKDQWLFNGIWRVQVKGVEPVMDGGKQTGWQVTEIWRNGTEQELSPGESFLREQQLVLAHGRLAANGYSQQNVGANRFAPAGQYTYKQVFSDANLDPSNEPKALSVTFDAAKLATMKGSKPQLTTSHHDFRFDLGCKASGAAALAQGGSTQLAARNACLGQWVSNGVWKVRAIGFEPNPNGGGWLVRQEWTNVSSHQAWTGGNDWPPALATSAGDEFLATKSGNDSASSNTVGDMNKRDEHRVPPGGSFTFAQLFVWSPFDANDKPTRLLVTFDAKRQNAWAGHPHYVSPANFRIALDCSKGA